MSDPSAERPNKPRRFGERLIPSLVLPALVVTSLALLVGERLRHRAQLSASTSPTPVIASAGGPLVRPPDTTVMASTRRFAGGGRVLEGAPTMRNLDPARTNRSCFRAPAQPKVAWTVELGSPIAVAPIIVTGAEEKRVILVATLAGRVITIGFDGKVETSVDVGDRVYGSPVLIGHYVWIGVDHGTVVAIDLYTGKIDRRLRLERAKDDADTALLPDPGPPASLFFAAGPTVYRVRTDGTFLFRETLPRKVYGSPARLPDGGLVVGGQDDALTILEADGKIRKRVPLDSDVDGSPAVGDDGTIYAGTDGGVVAAITPAGEIVWRVSVGGAVRGALAVARDGVVLVSTYGPTPAILGLDPRDGGRVLRFGIQGTGSREHGIHGAPIEAADGTLLFGGPDDLVHALGPDGRPLWTVDVGDDVDGTLMLLGDGIVIAATSAGRVVRIDAAP